MRWVLLGAGVLIGVPALLAGIGALLPRDHVSVVSLELHAGPEVVWTLISDLTGAARWRPDVESVEARPAVNGRSRFVEKGRQGDTPFEIVSQAAPTRQVVRVVDEGLPFGGTWTWEVEALPSGCRLTITEAGFIRNPFFRVMSRLFFPPTATLVGYLRAVAQELKETAEPQVVRAR